MSETLKDSRQGARMLKAEFDEDGTEVVVTRHEEVITLDRALESPGRGTAT